MMHTILEQPLSRNETVARLAIGLGATRVVANSEATANAARRWFSPARVVCIENGVDIRHFAEASADRRRWGLPHGVPVVASIGRLQRGKGHSTFVKAAEKLRGRAHFVVVGGTQFGMEKEYRDILAKEAAEAGVEMIGHIPELSTFYKSCDIVVLPSETPEAFGLVLAEAMAAGIAVIGTETGGPPLVIGDDGIVVPPGRPDALADAILSLLDSPRRRRELAARGALRASHRFSSERMAREWENLLTQPHAASSHGGHC